MEKVAIIIVAAGSSSRMNTAKQLLPLGDSTLLGNAVAQAKNSDAEDVFIVLGANSEKIRLQQELYKAVFVENKDWKQGIGSSIAAGIKYVAENGNFEGILLMLGDQPLIDSSYLNQLIAEFRKDSSKIIATKYPKSKGIPAIFPKKYFSQLLLLKGDAGAKSLLNSKKSSVLALDAGIKIMDVDTPEEYREFCKRYRE